MRDRYLLFIIVSIVAFPVLGNFGFLVVLFNEGQGIINHWQQFKLWLLLFSEQRRSYLPQICIDENECPNLCSVILISPLKRTDGKIELDNSNEKKQPLKLQAGLTTQLPSVMIYLLWGLYVERAMGELSSIPDDLPENVTI